MPKVCSELCQRSKMNCFAKLVKAKKLLTIFTTYSVLDALKGSEYPDAEIYFFNCL